MLSVIVKAFNEQANIGRCIESIIRETDGYDREIILVDSLSTDRTVAIAKQYQLRVVQFACPEDCGCGSAPQLGFQVSKGELIYLIDGDMEMLPGFLSVAIAYLKENPFVGGVGGLLVDRSMDTVFERRRAARYVKIKNTVTVRSLGGGGLYRREAIESVGYFSHQGLKACEELELGLRLEADGWRLVRIPCQAIAHTGHRESYHQSMIRLWRGGRLSAHGSLIRIAFGRKWFFRALLSNWYVLAPIVVVCCALLMELLLGRVFSVSIGVFNAFVITWGTVIILMAINKKSLKHAVLSVVSWLIIMLASIPAIARPIKDPCGVIKYREI